MNSVSSCTREPTSLQSTSFLPIEKLSVIVIDYINTIIALLDAPQSTAEEREALIAVQLHHYPERNESCIQCTFLNSYLSSCVVIIQKTVSYFHLSGLSTIVDVHRFDSEIDGQMLASGCLQQNLLNLTHHVIVVFAYDVQTRMMVGPAVVLQRKRHESINTEGD